MLNHVENRLVPSLTIPVSGGSNPGPGITRGKSAGFFAHRFFGTGEEFLSGI